MGLDMTAYAIDPTADKTQEPTKLAEWRKHPNLQGWMERLWREKTGNKDDAFNCQELELTEADLDSLFADIVLRNLPSTTGFFYGSNADDHYYYQDKFFVKDALEAVAKGMKVYYSSWW